MTQVTVQITTPVMRLEKFAEQTGMPIRTIQLKIQQGKIQIINKDKPKERPLINMVAYTLQCAKEAGYKVNL